MTEIDLKRLEERVESLISTCDLLKDENQALRVSQESLVGERAELIEKTELARKKVEAMITRLKSLET